jgi:hypothetical protein
LMISMILQKLLPTIIHCSALRGVGVLRFRVKLAGIHSENLQ